MSPFPGSPPSGSVCAQLPLPAEGSARGRGSCLSSHEARLVIQDRKPWLDEGLEDTASVPVQ